MADIREWSVTAASNTDLFPEGMAPSAVNDGLRAVQAEVAQLITDMRGTIATTGSSNAYNISLATTPSSLADGLFFSFTANHTNTGASTLAVTPGGGSAFTTKALRKNGAAGDIALGAGDIVSGNRYQVQYEASANSSAGGYIVLNPTFSSVISVTDITPGAATHEVTFPDGGFESYEITLRGFYPTTNSDVLSMQVKSGGGWVAANYFESLTRTEPTAITSSTSLNTTNSFSRHSAAAWQISDYVPNNASESCFTNIKFNPGTYGYPSIIVESVIFMGSFPPPATAAENFRSHGFVPTGAATAVRFLFSGTIGGGRVIVEGKRVA
jgi:hypothetical protein